MRGGGKHGLNGEKRLQLSGERDIEGGFPSKRDEKQAAKNRRLSGGGLNDGERVIRVFTLGWKR